MTSGTWFALACIFSIAGALFQEMHFYHLMQILYLLGGVCGFFWIFSRL